MLTGRAQHDDATTCLARVASSHISLIGHALVQHEGRYKDISVMPGSPAFLLGKLTRNPAPLPQMSC